MQLTVYLKSLGCRLNEAELSQWAIAFQKRGLGIAQEPESADCFVVNTCAVTQEAVRKSRQTIRQLQKKQPSAKSIASGCYVSLTPDEAEGLGLDKVVGNHEKDQLVDKVVDLLSVPSQPVQQTTDWASGIYRRGRSRAFIKAQDGCRYQCTFCIVTHARGAEVSKSAENIIDEINQFADSGIQEVIISGVHLGGYGSDIDSDLARMLKQVLAHTSIPRIRMGSIEPWGLDDRFFALFSDKRMMPHLHLPLQSGSDAILKKMARRCKRGEFLSLVQQAQDSIPNFTVSTDIIAGFPGETEADFAQSLSALELLPLLHAHIFPYSPREGTRAAGYDQQLSADSKKQRVKQLHDTASTQTQKTFAQYVGHQTTVLWESKVTPDQVTPGNSYLHGRTENFIPVIKRIPEDQREAYQHQLEMVTLGSLRKHGQDIEAMSVAL